MILALLLIFGPLMLEPDGMVVRQIWAPAEDVFGAPSPDGRYLSFVHWDTGDLAVRSLTTGENRQLTGNGSWNYSHAVQSVFSPDSEQIAYSWYNAKKKIYELRIVGVNGAQPRVLYSNEEVKYSQPTAWSADGKHIASVFSRQDRTNQIVLVPASGGSPRILKSLDWRWPGKICFSPDGKYLV